MHSSLSPETRKVFSRLINVESKPENDNKVFTSKNIVLNKHLKENISPSLKHPTLYLNKSPSSIRNIKVNEKFDPSSYDSRNEPFFQRIRMRRMYTDPVPWEYYLHENDDQHNYLAESLPAEMVESSVSPKFAIKTSLTEPFSRVCIRDACTQTLKKEPEKELGQDLNPKETTDKPKKRKVKRKKIKRKKVAVKPDPFVHPSLSFQPRSRHSKSRPKTVTRRVQYHEEVGKPVQVQTEAPKEPAKKKPKKQTSTQRSKSVQKHVELMEPEPLLRRVKRKPPVPVQKRPVKKVENVEVPSQPDEEDMEIQSFDMSDKEDALDDIAFIKHVRDNLAKGEQLRRETNSSKLHDTSIHSSSTDAHLSEEEVSRNRKNPSSDETSEASSLESSFESSRMESLRLERQYKENLLKIEQSRKRSEWIDKYIHLLVPPDENIAKALDSSLLSESSTVSLSSQSSTSSSIPAKLSSYSPSSQSPSIATSKLIADTKVYLEDLESSDEESDDSDSEEETAAEKAQIAHLLSSSYEDLVSDVNSSGISDIEPNESYESSSA